MEYLIEVTFKKNEVVTLSTSLDYEGMVSEVRTHCRLNQLKEFGFTDEEISIFEKTSETRTFVQNSLHYKLNDYGRTLFFKATKKLDKLISKEIKGELTLLEKELIRVGNYISKDKITDTLLPYVESVVVSSPKEEITFLINIIKNHIDIVNKVKIKGDFFSQDYKMHVTFNSYYDTKNYFLSIDKELRLDNPFYINGIIEKNLLFDAIPMSEFGINVKEDKFTKGLTTGLVEELEKMKVKRYQLRLDKKVLEKKEELEEKAKKELLEGNPNPLTKKELSIVRLPIYIGVFEKEVENYSYHSYLKELEVYNITEDWMEKANDIEHKKVTILDLLNFMEDIVDNENESIR